MTVLKGLKQIQEFINARVDAGAALSYQQTQRLTTREHHPLPVGTWGREVYAREEVVQAWLESDPALANIRRG